MSIPGFNRKTSLWFACVLLALNAGVASGQMSAFTYQGKLTDGANPANGTYDIQFKLFDTATVGTGHLLGTITNSSVPVSAGIFTVQLDFGAGAFSGPPRFLEIGVRQMGSPDPYTLLSPRQTVTSTPYSVRSLNSSVADVLSSACVGCVSSTQVGSVSGSAVTGTIPVASVPGGSDSYIQNTGVVQSADFNIDGDGRAYLFSATTEYQIGGQRVLGVTGSANTFAGIGAGALTTGDSNSFFGRMAGSSNTSGGSNSFFGERAGNQNSSGFGNSFFGGAAGVANTTGGSNAFFGRAAGQSNTTGQDNSFFGSQAGLNNIVGINNSFFGRRAGLVNTASNNSFFGYNSGDSNTTGTNNAFFGTEAGTANTTAAGNAFFGYRAGFANTAGGNSFFGLSAGNTNTSGSNNSFFGLNAGDTNTSGSNNTIIGENADVVSGNLSNATAIGAGAVVSQSNSLVLGNGVNVGIGTTSPISKLHVVGGSDAGLGGGGYIVAGLTASTNLVIDDNEIMARNIGAAAPLFLNNSGGNITMIQSGTGSVGIGTSSPAAKLEVNGAARANTLEVNGGAIRVIGAGVGTNTAAYIHVVSSEDDTHMATNLDHPLLNGNPNALVFAFSQTSTANHCAARGVQYDQGTWYILTFDDIGSCSVHTGDRFNVLIILP